MINKSYLERAANIRKDYVDIIGDINEYEKIAKQLVKSVSGSMHDLENLLESINSNKVSNIETAKSELETIMINTEIEMNNVDKDINVLSKKIDILKEQEKMLYREIKQTYPEADDESLRNEIHQYLLEKNLS